MNILSLKISQDIYKDKSMKVQPPTDKKPPKKENKLNRIKELSPKSIRRNISIDNFMKFQWSWTL